MCRNITPLRGLEPPATAEEIRSAAIQYARKISAITTSTGMASPAFVAAVDQIVAATTALLTDLPPRRTPPLLDPPLRRRAKQVG